MTGRVPTSVAPAVAEPESLLASAIKVDLAAGRQSRARERFGELVALQQRRASRIAYYYLRDGAEADEAVQDAFVKVFSHLSSFREDLSFEVWFTRILVNGCLDRIKARTRRERWLLPEEDAAGRHRLTHVVGAGSSPEEALLARETWRRVAGALRRLPERQRTVFVLSQIDGRSTREVSAITRLSESTVRVHLFRAIRKLRGLLGGT